LLDASSKTNDPQGLKSSIGTQCSGKKNEEQKESQHKTHRQEATPNQDSSIHQHNPAGRNKEGYEETTQKLNQAGHFIKEKYLQRVQVP
jgi:hypothetical protein